MIIWLASYPRSGNTFFRLLLKHSYGLPTYSVYPEGDLTGAEANTEMSFEDMVKAPDIYFVKTHELPEEDYPAVYLVRDGRDALTSYAHYILQYVYRIPKDEQPKQYDETLRMLIDTGYLYGEWNEHVLGWTGRSTRTAVVKFEDLINAPIESVQNAMVDVGYQLEEIQAASVPSFSELHEKVPEFFRKGQIGSWREEMREDLHNLFWNRNADAMSRMGYGDDKPQELNLIKAELAFLKNKYTDLQAHNNQLLEDLDSLQTEFSGLSEKYNELKTQNSQLLSEIEHLGLSNVEITTQNQALARVINEQQQELDRLAKIEKSWGWKFILRLNRLRSKIIQPGSQFERAYLSIRDILLGRN